MGIASKDLRKTLEKTKGEGNEADYMLHELFTFLSQFAGIIGLIWFAWIMMRFWYPVPQ